jgi:hypothetical protein
MLRVVFDAVPFQKCQKLFLETPLAMMLGLRSNVRIRIVLLRNPHCERPYPSCHAKSRVCSSFIHRDDAPFTSSMAFASGIVAGNDKRMCT